MKVYKPKTEDIVKIKKDKDFLWTEAIVAGVDNDYIFFAEKDKEIVGYIYAEEIKNMKSIMIFFLEVKEKYRKQGIASKLMEQLEEECRKNKIGSMLTTYKQDCSMLEDFYKKRGFDMNCKLSSAYKEV